MEGGEGEEEERHALGTRRPWWRSFCSCEDPVGLGLGMLDPVTGGRQGLIPCRIEAEASWADLEPHGARGGALLRWQPVGSCS